MKKYLLVLLPLLFSAAAWSQETQVTGKVMAGEDGLPIPGVNVVVEGTTKGTTTDVDGNYSLQLAPDENTLVFSFVGYKTVTAEVNGRSTIDITLQSDVTALEAIVVVGYGEQRKIDITGAVSNVEGEEITRQPW
jgi:hypothetical protein